MRGLFGKRGAVQDDATKIAEARAAQDEIERLLKAGRQMSAGDWSITALALRQAEGLVTTPSSAHGEFWNALVRLGWAEKLDPLTDPALIPDAGIQLFRPNADALNQLPAILFHAGLLGPVAQPTSQ